MDNYDVIIIGGGIIGGAIAYQIARYDLKILVLEKNPLLADETSKGNSGVIHGGFDALPEKLEAPLNVLGNRLWQTQIFKHLTFPRAQVDSLVLAFNEQEMTAVHQLYQRGLTNHVPEEFLKIISAKEVLKKEPHVNKKVKGALLCTSSWAIDPVKATLAFFGAAEKNGVQIEKSAAVTKIKATPEGFIVTVNDDYQVFAKNIINAAGHYADVIADMAKLGDFKQTTRRGEYRILSRSERKIVNSICFMVPTIHGKGVVVAPMLDGRIMVGPTAEENVAKSETRIVTHEKFDYISKIGKKIIPQLKMDKTEIVIAGSRPIDIETNDFVIRYGKNNHHFINAGGMQSPALSSAPAIALEVESLLQDNGTILKTKTNFDPKFKVMW